VKLATHLHLVPRLQISGTIHLTPPLHLHVHAHLNFTAFLPLLVIAISYEFRPSVMHDRFGLLKLGIFWVNEWHKNEQLDFLYFMKTPFLFTNTVRVMVQIFVMKFAKFFPSFSRNGINNLSKSKTIHGTVADEVSLNSFRKDTLYYVRKPT